MKIFLTFLLLLLLTGCKTMESYNENSSLLGKGINLGNYLEAPRDFNNDGIYDTLDGEGNWSGGRQITLSDIENISAKGFDHIRLPVRWSDYFTLEAPYRLDGEAGQKRLERVKEVISWARDNNLKVVLNVHHYTQMMDGTLLTKDEHINRLKSIWTLLSNEFPIEEYPEDFLIFELLNEPHTQISFLTWNGIINELTKIIWAKDSNRIIMIGTADWGGVPGLGRLDLPMDCTPLNTIITIHYYEPFKFTHQGASWSQGAEEWIGTRWRGTKSEKSVLLGLFDDIDRWNSRGFEIYIGEFGVYSAYSNPKDQSLWTSFIVNESNKRGYSWAYWEYSEGFGAYDKVKGLWKPQLIDALLPQ